MKEREKLFRKKKTDSVLSKPALQKMLKILLRERNLYKSERDVHKERNGVSKGKNENKIKTFIFLI